ncbi:uncharacterized protein STEHIDRAFT_157180 [Stereum hirsutum FP-91666 SS1]|uniref:uncharacterized protein n=1 Tax=Stereum hirsutum (strain FP-91666) TaxID=721885 RepID=UPI0004449D07|nr:uncharacterized protein STEHIDRAFT_157180 [Stereum hirsutum FP-91666 SS1]EIM86888.1 hypothetical protein STEHIDRAFT_157180 [Stereum hirsutum FP-91666 SS1]
MSSSWPDASASQDGHPQFLASSYLFPLSNSTTSFELSVSPFDRYPSLLASTQSLNALPAISYELPLDTPSLSRNAKLLSKEEVVSLRTSLAFSKGGRPSWSKSPRILVSAPTGPRLKGIEATTPSSLTRAPLTRDNQPWPPTMRRQPSQRPALRSVVNVLPQCTFEDPIHTTSPRKARPEDSRRKADADFVNLSPSGASSPPDTSRTKGETPHLTIHRRESHLPFHSRHNHMGDRVVVDSSGLARRMSVSACYSTEHAGAPAGRRQPDHNVEDTPRYANSSDTPLDCLLPLPEIRITTSACSVSAIERPSPGSPGSSGKPSLIALRRGSSPLPPLNLVLQSKAPDPDYYPTIPTAFRGSPEAGSPTFNLTGPSEVSSLGIDDMIGNLHMQLAHLKPSTPTELQHSEVDLTPPMSQTPSLCPNSPRPSLGGSEDEWAFADDLLTKYAASTPSGSSAESRGSSDIPTPIARPLSSEPKVVQPSAVPVSPRAQRSSLATPRSAAISAAQPPSRTKSHYKRPSVSEDDKVTRRYTAAAVPPSVTSPRQIDLVTTDYNHLASPDVSMTQRLSHEPSRISTVSDPSKPPLAKVKPRRSVTFVDPAPTTSTRSGGPINSASIPQTKPRNIGPSGCLGAMKPVKTVQSSQGRSSITQCSSPPKQPSPLRQTFLADEFNGFDYLSTSNNSTPSTRFPTAKSVRNSAPTPTIIPTNAARRASVRVHNFSGNGTSDPVSLPHSSQLVANSSRDSKSSARAGKHHNKENIVEATVEAGSITSAPKQENAVRRPHSLGQHNKGSGRRAKSVMLGRHDENAIQGSAGARQTGESLLQRARTLGKRSGDQIKKSQPLSQRDENTARRVELGMDGQQGSGESSECCTVGKGDKTKSGMVIASKISPKTPAPKEKSRLATPLRSILTRFGRATS